MSKTFLWANDFPPITSGIATFFVNIWRCLPSDRVTVIAPRMQGTTEVDGALPFPVRRLILPIGENAVAKGIKTLITTVYFLYVSFTQRPERHHCGQLLSSGIPGLICRKLLGIPYVVYVYGSETIRFNTDGLARWLIHAILSESDYVIANSEYTAMEFKMFGIESDHIRVIYPGVDPQRFKPEEPDPELIERYHLEGKCVLMTIARLDERKGHDVVLEALDLLTEEFPNLVYLIGGKGREEERLRLLAHRLEIEDRVQFIGYVPEEDLARHYNLCDVFVMPNRITTETTMAGDVEGFGISFIEASACGKPVIAGMSGGAVEAVIDGETGLLVDSKSPKAVAEAIRRLVRNGALAQRLGRTGRQRVETAYDWRFLAKQVEEIL